MSLHRFMATGKHIGKVLLRVREEEAGGARPATKLVSAIPRTYLHPAKSYVLVGKSPSSPHVRLKLQLLKDYIYFHKVCK